MWTDDCNVIVDLQFNFKKLNLNGGCTIFLLFSSQILNPCYVSKVILSSY